MDSWTAATGETVFEEYLKPAPAIAKGQILRTDRRLDCIGKADAGQK